MMRIGLSLGNRILVVLSFFASFAFAQPPVQRADPLPRGIGEIERDIGATLKAPLGFELTPIPEWAGQGRFMFMRMDGGVMEREKAKRSIYGQSFTDEESRVLGDLYTTHADRIIDLMKEAGVNWVWITWSNGWSLSYESQQWAVLRTLISKLHAQGIKITAYLCATSMFWQNMFLEEPRSVTWLTFLPNSIQVPYGQSIERPLYPFTPDWTPVSYGRRTTYRFIADLGNPEWRNYVKRRVGAAIDAGVDGIFFDNPLVGRPKIDEALGFFAEIQRFIKNEKKSPVLLSTHIGAWMPSTVPLDELCEVIFSGGSEPGLIDGKWRSNIPVWRYQRNLVGDKPMYGEIIGNFPPSGTTGIMSPKAQKIAIAEGASAQFNVANRVFGPFLKGIVLNEPKAMQSWSAIGQYNRFLLQNSTLYEGARIAPDLLVVLPDGWPFGQGKATGALLEFLAQESFQFEVVEVSRLAAANLKNHKLVLLAATQLEDRHSALLTEFRRTGGRIYGLGGRLADSNFVDVGSSDFVWASLSSSLEAQSEIRTKTESLLSSRKIKIRVENPGKILATVTSLPDGKTVAHLINHAPEPRTSVKVEMALTESEAPGIARARIYSPDFADISVIDVRLINQGASFTIPRIDTYVVVVLGP